MTVEAAPEPVVVATPPAAAAPAAAPEQSFDIGQFIEKDGKFKEGFKNSLVPEELRANKVYDIFPDIQSLTKYAGNASIELGKYRSGKGVIPLSDKSSPAEIDSWRMAHGVPKDATGYTWKPAEEISVEDLSPEFLQNTFTEFNKANYTPKQVETAMNMFAGHIKSIEKAVDTEMAKRVEDADRRFNEEYGEQAPAKTNLAKEFITRVAGHWDKNKYEALFGKEVKLEDGTTTREGGINEPEFADTRILLLDLFSNIQEKFGIEDSALTPESTGTPSKSLSQQVEDADRELYENVKLRDSLDHRDRNRYEELMKKRDALYKRLYPA